MRQVNSYSPQPSLLRWFEKQKRAATAALFPSVDPNGLAQVFADQAGQFKHGDLAFAENSFEFVISVDVALVDFVLQIVLFDVSPHFADNFSAGQRA